MSDQAEAAFLGELFRCERYVSLFPTGMPMRACLRRQLERQPSKDAKGRPLPAFQWPAAKPYCADQCALGREQLARARAAHVPAETCLTCGSAQVGTGSAAPCLGCKPNEKLVPRGALPAGQGKSDRLWNGEAPDVPFAAPGPARAVPRVTFEENERRAVVRRVELEDDDQDVPDEPAEEEELMACGECGSKTVHKGWCEKRPGGPMKGEAGKKPSPKSKAPGDAQEGRVKAAAAKVTPLRPATPRRAREAGGDLRAMPLDELLEKRSHAAGLITSIDHELRRRQEEIAKALDARDRVAP